MSDSRIDILTAHYVKENSHPQYASTEDDIYEARHEAEWTIADLEAAGLVVIDPKGERGQRILRAAMLAIEDRAPLFDGPAPLNTNQFDQDAYRSDAR